MEAEIILRLMTLSLMTVHSSARRCFQSNFFELFQPTISNFPATCNFTTPDIIVEHNQLINITQNYISNYYKLFKHRTFQNLQVSLIQMFDK